MLILQIYSLFSADETGDMSLGKEDDGVEEGGDEEGNRQCCVPMVADIVDA